MSFFSVLVIFEMFTCKGAIMVLFSRCLLCPFFFFFGFLLNIEGWTKTKYLLIFATSRQHFQILDFLNHFSQTSLPIKIMNKSPNIIMKKWTHLNGKFWPPILFLLIHSSSNCLRVTRAISKSITR